MRIECINLKNYRQYRGPMTINFSDISDGKNITVIQGPNGSGKSNIMNSITWCLYGNEIHLKTSEKALPLISTKAFDGLDSNDIVEVEVEIHMRGSDDKKFIFTRKAGFKKDYETNKIYRVPLESSNSKAQQDGTVFEIMYQDGRDMKNVYIPEYFIEQLFPSDIREYFFFDGESLDKYFLQSPGERIEQAVFDISQISIIEVVQKKLENRKRIFVKSLKFLNPKVEELEKRLAILKESEKTHKERLYYHEEERKKAEKHEAELSRKLRECSAGNVREFENKRVKLELDISNAKNRIEILEGKKFDHLIDNAPTIYCFNSISETIDIIEENTEKGKLPPKVRRIFIEDILKQGKCICGTELIKGSECRNKIEHLLKLTDPVSDISEHVIEGRVLLRNLLENLKDFGERQNNYSIELKQLRDKLIIDNQEIDMISKKIKGTDLDEVNRWETELQKYKDLIKNVSEEISTHKLRLKNVKSTIDSINLEIQKEADKQGKHAELSKILRFCTDSINALETIKNEIMHEVREKIQDKTKEHFFNLIWKKETYSDVRIDEKYNISVINNDGLESLDSLSSGERQVLALSFMAALNDVSGFQAPIIIDTPLGRISQEPRLNIADSLPSYLKNRQVTILATEEEYTKEVRERLLPSVGKEYKINFRDLDGESISEVVDYE
jgi:DNA sulfur modification protein DndD